VPPIAQDGTRLRAARVRTGSRLGQAKGPQLFASRQGDEILLLLLLAAKEIERAGTQRGMRFHSNSHRDIASRDFLDSDAVGEKIRARPAVFLRERKTQQPQCAHFAHDVVGELARAIHFLGAWFDFLFGKITARLTYCRLLLVERKIHDDRLSFSGKVERLRASIIK
jgi:hypothetical protein